MSSPTFSRVYRTNAGVVIDGVRHPSAISPASACIFGAVAATYTGGTSRGACASAASAGTSALHVSPSYSKRSPESTPRAIVTASRIGPRVFVVWVFVLLRKIFDVPKPRMKRPGPAASCTTRASIAAWTGCRVDAAMIPQPIVSRFVSRPMSAPTPVDERASMPCFRHQGYASASQIVSMPASSIARADATICSSGSIVSCITPMRKGGGITSILSRQFAVVEGRRREPAVGSRGVARHHPELRVADGLVERASVGFGVRRQPEQRQAAAARLILDRLHEQLPDPGPAD